MKQNIQEGLQNILDAINNIIEPQLDKLRYDRTYRAKVTKIISATEYKVQINSKTYNITYQGALKIGQIIKVKSPLNNFSDIYIEPTETVYEFTKTLNLATANTWYDTGISFTDLPNGAYIMQVYINNVAIGQYNETRTGLVQWYSRATNSTNTDSIYMTGAGHARNNHVMSFQILRVGGSTTGIKLQMSDTIGWETNNVSVNFRFKNIM